MVRAALGRLSVTKITIEELKVLVIDDDRHMCMLIRNVLFALGVKDVTDAKDGKTGRETMAEFSPNLVICDLKMKPMGGLEFVRQVRNDPENPHRLVPIIMVTAYADLEAVAGARDTGVNEFMAKPISAAALEKRIRHVLDDPRAFVESETFSGPDRRRGKKVSLSGPERREEEPTFLTPPKPPAAGE